MLPTNVTVNLSHRHIHLSAADMVTLFGAGYTLNKKADLLQPEQFAAQETVTVTGPGGALACVRIVGPVRDVTQCEILTGDVYTLGYPSRDVPTRLSGDLADSAAFTITGPAGSVEKDRGLIVAQRHIHIDPATAALYRLVDGEVVGLQLSTPHKETLYKDVIIRAQEGAKFECHLDIEEGNAAGIANGHQGTIVRL